MQHMTVINREKMDKKKIVVVVVLAILVQQCLKILYSIVLTGVQNRHLTVHSLQKKKHFKRNFQCLISLKKCSRATLRCLAGRMWPAGRTLPRPGLGLSFLTFFASRHPWYLIYWFLMDDIGCESFVIGNNICLYNI